MLGPLFNVLGSLLKLSSTESKHLAGRVQLIINTTDHARENLVVSPMQIVARDALRAEELE